MRRKKNGREKRKPKKMYAKNKKNMDRIGSAKEIHQIYD